MSLHTHTFATSNELVTVFSQRIADTLKQAISEKGQASLVVSGGSTPLPLFKALAAMPLEWSKVTITLADERWVDSADSASNEKLVRENLLTGHAASANFIPLKTHHSDANEALEQLSATFTNLGLPFDIVILGMGEDGHTASLFPCSEQIEAGLDVNSPAMLIATQPTTAPHQRMSFTLRALVSATHVFLHLTGDKKRAVLMDALENATDIEKPIKAVCDKSSVELMWAP
ncbi:6-phosphogluconolactonase [Glaciecola sp. MH2013]|uniref:6-phosphogluconolactonase n=1 Tax=Glaciecola sp. MH2013 TaxID=2785524 RepID=UPI00189DE81F|nr:6-phosphogluconolactonase [Glaciecola sp. MH2013]MBF7072596.1 6-phosphogluconolactonase [Glaciecola sp. MH2013]